MKKSVNMQELAIVVVANNHNPTILNPDFLKYNGIVPCDWELEKNPICTDLMAQVVFKNNVNITAQLDKVIFLEFILGKRSEEVTIPEIAHKYVNTLPHVDYKAVGINPKGHVDFNNNEEMVRRYIVETLVTPGPWQEYGEEPVVASVKFIYKLDGSLLTLTIDKATLNLTGINIPIVLFSANFHYDIVGATKDERLDNLFLIIRNWGNDFEVYRDIVNNRLLDKEFV